MEVTLFSSFSRPLVEEATSPIIKPVLACYWSRGTQPRVERAEVSSADISHSLDNEKGEGEGERERVRARAREAT